MSISEPGDGVSQGCIECPKSFRSCKLNLLVAAVGATDSPTVNNGGNYQLLLMDSTKCSRLIREKKGGTTGYYLVLDKGENFFLQEERCFDQFHRN